MFTSVHWDDQQGNLYEAALFRRGYQLVARIKKWDAAGRQSGESGAHSIRYEGKSPPAHESRLIKTLRSNAVSYGCPPEKVWELK